MTEKTKKLKSHRESERDNFKKNVTSARSEITQSDHKTRKFEEKKSDIVRSAYGYVIAEEEDRFDGQMIQRKTLKDAFFNCIQRR